MTGRSRVSVVGYASLDTTSSVAEFRGVDATSILSHRFTVDSPTAGGIAHLTGAAAAAGVNVEAVSWVGDDRFGALWRRSVAEQGAGTSGVTVHGARSPSASLVHIASGGTLCFFDPGDCHTERLTDEQRALLLDSEWVVLTVAPTGITEDVLRTLAPGNRLAWAVKRDENAYSEALVRSILARADLISFSAGERAWLCLGGLPPEQLARTGTLIVETRGREGVLFRVAGIDEAEIETVDPVNTTDTTGAGDTFLGTLVAQLAGRCPPADLDRATLRSSVSTAATAVADLLRRRSSDLAGASQKEGSSK